MLAWYSSPAPIRVKGNWSVLLIPSHGLLTGPPMWKGFNPPWFMRAFWVWVHPLERGQCLSFLCLIGWAHEFFPSYGERPTQTFPTNATRGGRNWVIWPKFLGSFTQTSGHSLFPKNRGGNQWSPVSWAERRLWGKFLKNLVKFPSSCFSMKKNEKVEGFF